VEERRLRVGSVFEWIAAAVAVALLLWVVSVPIQRVIGPSLQAAIGEAELTKSTPPGVPDGAIKVPVMLFLDGREIRQGDLHSRLEQTIPGKFADGPPYVTRARFGDRHTRAYHVSGSRFYVVCERSEPNGPMKIAGIFVP
jgi:hypothetical protein